MGKKKLRKKIKKLRGLVQHAWVHDGYSHCGYDQMTTPQKKLYCKVIGVDFEEFNEEFFESRRKRVFPAFANDKGVVEVNTD